jgi:hypothetical protein
MKLGKPIAVRVQAETDKMLQTEAKRKGLKRATLIRTILNERYESPKKGDWT